MKVRIAIYATLLGCLAAQAGEIVIIQPAEKDPRSVREPTRSERELGRTMDKARNYGGTGGGLPVIIDETAGPRPQDRTEDAIREAQDYLRSGAGPSGMSGMGGTTTIILRAAPTSETEKLRQKARSYSPPDNASRGKNCPESANTVGSIGDGASADRSSVSEKGNSVVSTGCK